jgi:hypothetical protein
MVYRRRFIGTLGFLVVVFRGVVRPVFRLQIGYVESIQPA